MKVTYYALAFMMCLNGMTLLLQYWGVSPLVMSPFNSSNIESVYNATEMMESIDPSDKEFYDIGTGAMYLWNQNVPLIEDAFKVFEALGMTSDTEAVFLTIWRFFWVGFLLSFISGRDFMP